MVAFFSKLAVVATAFLGGVSGVVFSQGDAPQMLNAKPAAATPRTSGLRGGDPQHVFAAVNRTQAPCACVANDPSWKACTRTTPRCVFIDLGAADGNSFNHFMANGYGPVANCPSGQWSAVLVEANPRFDSKLGAVGKEHNNVNVMSATAAYMCEAKTSFFLDTVNTEKNFWGSSMSSSHPDVQRSGAQQKVTVPTMNLNRILYEQAIPGDWVMVKMDIEGSEFDVLPCLAEAPAASLVDRLYLEQHDPSWGMTGTTPVQMEAAKAKLRKKGVDIPKYFSWTL
jgi:FkbM family methyltransferase